VDAHDPLLVDVRDGVIEVVDAGAGEPVLLVQTALLAEEFRPLCDEPALAGHRLVRMHRRGYAGSSPAAGPRGIADDAADCLALLDALGLDRAHVVGLSFSSVVALQLAADAPHRVRSLSLVEAPPVGVPSDGEFRAANAELLAERAAHGPAAALDRFQARLLGPDWRAVVERLVPGAVAQMTRDAATFFDSDVPALLSWRFGRDDARRVACPVLYVGGGDSGRWFDEVRELVVAWFPHTEVATVAGAGHDLALTHPAEVAAALAGFVARHS
jgi:pimeloyl-ACP methyl ester carboxylesterase